MAKCVGLGCVCIYTACIFVPLAENVRIHYLRIGFSYCNKCMCVILMAVFQQLLLSYCCVTIFCMSLQLLQQTLSHEMRQN